jgi:hypothetical protein
MWALLCFALPMTMNKLCHVDIIILSFQIIFFVNFAIYHLVSYIFFTFLIGYVKCQ